MANTNKEPNLVRAYLDKRDEMRAPCWHVNHWTGRRIQCTGKGCPICKEKRRVDEIGLD